jgi:hypothetical protein
VLSIRQALAAQLGIAAERVTDCSADGAASGALASQLRRCARRGVAVGNRTLVIVHVGGEDIRAAGAHEAAALLRALLLRGHAPPLDALFVTRPNLSGVSHLCHRARNVRYRYGRALNFTASVCDALGCPRAFVLSSLPLARGASALDALPRAAEPFLHARLPRAIDSAARCAAVAALQGASFHQLVRLAQAAADPHPATPLVLFNEFAALGDGRPPAAAANWWAACQQAAACEGHISCHAALRVRRTPECAAAVSGAAAAALQGMQDVRDAPDAAAGTRAAAHAPSLRLLLSLYGWLRGYSLEGDDRGI